MKTLRGELDGGLGVLSGHSVHTVRGDTYVATAGQPSAKQTIRPLMCGKSNHKKQTIQKLSFYQRVDYFQRENNATDESIRMRVM